MPSAPSGPSWSMRSGSLRPDRIVATSPAARRCFTLFGRMLMGSSSLLGSGARDGGDVADGIGLALVGQHDDRLESGGGEAEDVRGLVVQTVVAAETLDHAER